MSCYEEMCVDSLNKENPTTHIERLIADLERRSEVHAELAKQGKKAEPWPELLARAATALRTMQAERDAALKEVRFHVDDAVKAWNAHEAAEAKLAEVEKERDEQVRKLVEMAKCADAEAATAASLQAQVETMRGTLEFYAKWPTPQSVDEYSIYDDCGQIARAALTTEKTNG